MLGDPTLEGTRESKNQRLVNIDIYAPAYCTDPSIRIRLNLNVTTPESESNPIGPEQPELRFYSDTISQRPRPLGKLGKEADLTYHDSDDLPKNEKVANHPRHIEHWSRRDLSCLEMKVNPSLANLTNSLSDLTSAQIVSLEKLESLAKAERILVYSEGSPCFENSMPYLQQVFSKRGPSVGPCHHPQCAGFHPYNTTQLPDDLLEVLNNPVPEKSCFQCNEPGHKAHNCPKVQCHTCQEFGHMKWNCPSKPKRRRNY